ncbi:hypothetical protein A2U01_0004621 [Trifolium medium]|uniref:Uncharacterized protein n=1 Tax=Trifolium medium TaxID=97028 RepID=A0A392M9L5_9FABA|nr:hypothetical protein [Trifolium medium]
MYTRGRVSEYRMACKVNNIVDFGINTLRYVGGLHRVMVGWWSAQLVQRRIYIIMVEEESSEEVEVSGLAKGLGACQLNSLGGGGERLETFMGESL